MIKCIADDEHAHFHCEAFDFKGNCEDKKGTCVYQLIEED